MISNRYNRLTERYSIETMPDETNPTDSTGLPEFADEPVRIPITDVFDLHSVPPRDAKFVLEAYLDEAHRLGMTAIRIIHGRGIGVQREMVRKILARTPYVVAFGDAPAEAGGWGATVATLRPVAGETRTDAE
jgi:dsDNA-specific endonuclease/ATPase MutS2